ncbi:MAG: thiamine phosphate synthase [Deltaproteobacteria bacterium]|nr:thiamine phosphate synthase [Deltaproteobacteria bacterium]
MRRLDLSLYLVTDRHLARTGSVESIAAEALKGGVTMVQLREKDLGAGDIMKQALRLKELTDGYGVPLIINDRLDIALACRAAGVHLGQEDLPCAAARRIAGREFIIGVSVSKTAEALEAEGQGADYLATSPVFSTATKTDAPIPLGVRGLVEIRRHTRLPLVAIGGLHAGNAAEIIQAGADGIAVVSAIMASPSPRAAAMELRLAVERARGVHKG